MLQYEDTPKASGPIEESKEVSGFGYGVDLSFKRTIPSEILKLKGVCPYQPTSQDPCKRHISKVMEEQEAFDPSRYMFDNFDEDVLPEITQLTQLKLPSTLSLES